MACSELFKKIWSKLKRDVVIEMLLIHGRKWWFLLFGMEMQPKWFAIHFCGLTKRYTDMEREIFGFRWGYMPQYRQEGVMILFLGMSRVWLKKIEG